MKFTCTTTLTLLVFAVFASSVSAELSLSTIFTDHMVLQRQMPIVVWGSAEAGERITVSFCGKSATATANKDARWQVKLPAMEADNKPHELVVKGKSATLTLEDVLLGEVWICTGQSNMAAGERNAETIKNLRIAALHSTTPRKNLMGEVKGWVHCSKDNAWAIGWQPSHPFTHVGYRFGKHLLAETKVPVGLIEAVYGGTKIELWTPHPLKDELWGKDLGKLRIERANPGSLYWSKIEGMTKMSIRGVFLYQGEDDNNNPKYSSEMKHFIESWRKRFDKPDLEFLITQITPMGYRGGPLGTWGAQVWATKNLPRTQLVPTQDLWQKPRGRDKASGWSYSGGNAHPPNKHIAAVRAADIALAKIYGRDLKREVFGPMYVSHTTKGNKLTVTFDYVGEGLRISKNDKESGKLTWFELAAEPEDGKKLAWCKANARIVHKKYVEVSADDVPNPKYVRFAWHPVSFHNLESSAGLPAIGFRTDMPPERWHER